MFDPLSDKTSGYHLFLEPSDELVARLSVIIRTVAAEYNAPIFPPHVTLLGRIPDDDEQEIVQRARDLAASLTPFTLTLGALESKQSYFRALYSRLIQQEEMGKCHAKAAQMFSLEPDPQFVAHLSLLYGNYPYEMKARTKNSIEFPHGSSFTVHALHLYKTEGGVEDWYKVDEFPFDK